MKRIAVVLVAWCLLVGMYATAFAAYGPDDLTVLSVGPYTEGAGSPSPRRLVDVPL